MGEQDDVALRCATIAVAIVGQGDLDAALSDVFQLPPDLAARGVLAAGLLTAVVGDDPMAGMQRLRAVRRLLEIADGPQPPTPRWTRTVTAARLLDLMRRLAEASCSTSRPGGPSSMR